MSKVGFIFECGPQGADKQVCEYLAKQVNAGIIPVSRTLDDKTSLLREAGNVAAALFEDGCERVLIIWDLRPAWPDMKEKPCRKAECDSILAAVAQAGVAGRPVYLICVEQELESWLLADETKIAAYLSTPAHAYTVKSTKKPDRVPNPKSVMMKHFKTARGTKYEDRIHAIKIISSGDINLRKLRRSPTFVRFSEKLSC
ncbi:MAG: DUF4276 family protein [Desulfuromonadales bacterium]|nr:DUF4276 family protein [Desulfuromonadales bacterium]